MFFRPALRGASPINTVLNGPPGTGKTAAVRRIFAEVEETSRTAVPVLVSCQVDRTAYAVYGRMYLALFGQTPPPSGVPPGRLVERIAREANRRGAVLVVCLDDAGYLVREHVLNDLVAGILRMHEGYPGTRTGVVLTVSDAEVDLSRCLDAATRSVLQPSAISFPPYATEEIREILADRIRAGVYPGVFPPGALDCAAERTHACGDLRVGENGRMSYTVLRAAAETGIPATDGSGCGSKEGDDARDSGAGGG